MFKLKAYAIGISFLLLSSTGFAAGGSMFGFNYGFGVPYVTQVGLNYTFSSSMSAELSMNSIDLDAGMASVSLSKPEVALKWHPFEGSFFVSLGVGQQTLKVTGTDSVTQLTAVIEVTAMTATANLGWMWGLSDGGIFFGIDFGVQKPFSPKTTITSALSTTDQAYIDAVDAGDKFGEAPLPVMTLFRLGYMF